MRPKSDAAQSVPRRFDGKSEPTSHDELQGIRFALELRIGPMTWSRTGSASNLQAAQRHAAAIGGEVRARRIRTNEVVARWVEGDEVAK